MDIRQFFTSRAEAGSNGVQDNATDTVTGSLGPTSPETFTEVTTSSETNDLLTLPLAPPASLVLARSVLVLVVLQVSVQGLQIYNALKGPHQPRDCEFPKQRFSNGICLSINLGMTFHLRVIGWNIHL